MIYPHRWLPIGVFETGVTSTVGSSRNHKRTTSIVLIPKIALFTDWRCYLKKPVDFPAYVCHSLVKELGTTLSADASGEQSGFLFSEAN